MLSFLEILLRECMDFIYTLNTMDERLFNYKNEHLLFLKISKILYGVISLGLLIYVVRMVFFGSYKIPIYNKGPIIYFILSITVLLFTIFLKNKERSNSHYFMGAILVVMILYSIIKVPNIDIVNGNVFERRKELPYKYITSLDSYWPGWELNTARVELFASIYFKDKNVYTSEQDSFTIAKNPSHIGNTYERFILPNKYHIEKPYIINDQQKTWLEEQELITFLTSDQKTVKFVFEKDWDSVKTIIVVNDRLDNYYYISKEVFDKLNNL